MGSQIRRKITQKKTNPSFFDGWKMFILKKKLSPLQLRTFSSRNSKKKTDALTQNNPPKMAKRKKKRKSNQVPVKSKTIKSIFPWELLIANPFEKTMVVFIRKKKPFKQTSVVFDFPNQVVFPAKKKGALEKQQHCAVTSGINLNSS